MYNTIISIENLLEAWKEFLRGKKNKIDVQEFERNLMSNIINLHIDLKNKTYAHGAYKHFKISDPKPRDIHKACVRDRLVHHALYRILYPHFDTKFIHDSYSCRLEKGTHKAINRLRYFERKVSKNHTRTCFVLKCDIRKFFASIDHEILIDILNKHIEDKEVVYLLKRIINSFNSGAKGKGLPLGNLTSQLLVNIYMNEFDQLVKHTLREKYYIRYADDFVFLSENKVYLENLIPSIHTFLEENLKLNLHPNKVFIKTYSSGIDFLGWVHFSKYRVLRTTTKNRMFTKLELNEYEEKSILSYLGLLSHGNSFKLIEQVKYNQFYFINKN